MLKTQVRAEIHQALNVSNYKKFFPFKESSQPVNLILANLFKMEGDTRSVIKN